MFIKKDAITHRANRNRKFTRNIFLFQVKGIEVKFGFGICWLEKLVLDRN